VRLVVTTGTRPLVLVAPHGGRRDAARRPWTIGNLRMNDLHTAELTRELAARTGASAVINAEHDRNDVDLNRISAAHEHAPAFLERLLDVLGTVVARHGRATLLALHGWNVVQPVVDVGLGCAPGDDPLVVGPRAAVTPRFAAGALARFIDACGARGIGATVGARYPARHRENLLQLFTPRYRDDERPLVRALAALAPGVDALQLELGIAVRWPGRWRDALVAACEETLPAFLVPPDPTSRGAARVDAAPAAIARRLQFTSAGLSGLVGLDRARGGRLLLFPPEGGLLLFTGERIGLAPAAVTGALAVRRTPAAGVAVRFRGALLRFPDTTPFLDLETGLARATLADAEIALDFERLHPDAAGDADFGVVRGVVRVDGAEHAIAAAGFTEDGPDPTTWPRLRAALRVGETAYVAFTLALDGGAASGFLCADGGHVAIVGGRAALAHGEAALEHVDVTLELADGARLELAAHAVHRLPVIRARGATPLRIEFVACRLDGETSPAGWLEAGGI
jgi:hypothetical protein